jgi:hydrogenase maturation protease
VTTYVLGLGNVLMGDDGFGPAVVRAFDEQFVSGPDVEVVDLGTPGLDLSPWFADADRLIIVDTVRSAQPPGTIGVYSKEEILRHSPRARVSPHDPGVKETLLTLELAGRAPGAVTLVGAVPASTELSLDLSAALAAAMPAAVAAIVKLLRDAGFAVARRSGARSCTTSWWRAELTQPLPVD